MTTHDAEQRFYALPEPSTASGEERRVGVEIEFSGLSEDEVATILQARFGGEISRDDPHSLQVDDSAVGTLKVELDTAIAKNQSGGLRDKALDLLRGVVPVEIVTEPLTRDAVVQFNAVIDDLRNAGAVGSRDGLLFGFGVHLNVEVVDAEAAMTLRTVRSFALLEAWLRAEGQIDTMRRILPFVKAWPAELIDGLVRHKPQSMADLIDLCDPHIQSRNHSLDLLPLFKWAVPQLFEASYPDDTATKARPAFHFRLPDSRINEEDWSLHASWAMWHQVEEVAASDMLEALEDARMRFIIQGTTQSAAAWANETRDIVEGIRE